MSRIGLNGVGIALLFGAISGLSGCATSPVKVKFDPQAAERARPYLDGYRAADLRTIGDSGKTVICVEPKASASWKDWVETATVCVQKEDWTALERVAFEMAKRELNSPWGAYFLGVAAAGRGDLSRAEWMYDLAERKTGGPLAVVRYEKARLLERDGANAPTAEVAKEMKEAVRLDPELVPALVWLAQVYHRDRMLSDAEVYYRQILKVNASHLPSLLGLSEVAIEKSDGQQAAEWLSKAVTLRPESGETRFRLAFVYETLLKDQAKSLETLRELKVAVEKGRARFKSSDLTQTMGSKIRSLEQALKADPSNQAKGREPAQKKGG